MPSSQGLKSGGEVYVIAEMACSHEGNPDLARKIIDGAGNGGADAIQFQIWFLPRMMVPHHPDYPKLQKLELSLEVWADLAAYSRRRYPRMQIIACVYELQSVDFAEKINVDAYKIHASDLANPELIQYVANTQKRIDLSVGCSSLEEIQTAIQWIQGCSNEQIWLMYGYQGFPTPTDAVHLNYMMALQKLFQRPVGYQDHSAGSSDAAFWLPAAAVGMGVRILEKHITHDPAFKGIDHEAALGEKDFRRFVEMVRVIEESKGVAVPQEFSPEQVAYRKYSRKSIVAARDLAVGERFAASDFLFLRSPEMGFPPVRAGQLIGRRIQRVIRAYHPIQEEDFS